MDRISIILLDKARQMCEPPTDYQLAKRLEIKHQTLTRCRHHGGTLDNEAASKLAELLGQEPYDVIAIMELERAKTPRKRAFWESRLPRILPVVAYLGAVTGTLTTLLGVLHPIHYAKWLDIRPALLELRLSSARRTRFALAG